MPEQPRDSENRPNETNDPEASPKNAPQDRTSEVWVVIQPDFMNPILTQVLGVYEDRDEANRALFANRVATGTRKALLHRRPARNPCDHPAPRCLFGTMHTYLWWCEDCGAYANDACTNRGEIPENAWVSPSLEDLYERLADAERGWNEETDLSKRQHERIEEFEKKVRELGEAVYTNISAWGAWREWALNRLPDVSVKLSDDELRNKIEERLADLGQILAQQEESDEARAHVHPSFLARWPSLDTTQRSNCNHDDVTLIATHQTEIMYGGVSYVSLWWCRKCGAYSNCSTRTNPNEIPHATWIKPTLKLEPETLREKLEAKRDCSSGLARQIIDTLIEVLT